MGKSLDPVLVPSNAGTANRAFLSPSSWWVLSSLLRFFYGTGVPLVASPILQLRPQLSGTAGRVDLSYWHFRRICAAVLPVQAAQKSRCRRNVATELCRVRCVTFFTRGNGTCRRSSILPIHLGIPVAPHRIPRENCLAKGALGL